MSDLNTNINFLLLFIDNITDYDPYVGMQIDFRDNDFIWSSATIVAVHQPTVAKSLPDPVNETPKPSFQSLSVTVRYDGTLYSSVENHDSTF